MEILKGACAGTIESSDAYVEIEPNSELNIQIESIVKKQFGDKIELSVREVLADHAVTSAIVRVMDRGALDCVIRARVETAIKRCRGEQ